MLFSFDSILNFRYYFILGIMIYYFSAKLSIFLCNNKKITSFLRTSEKRNLNFILIDPSAKEITDQQKTNINFLWTLQRLKL